MERSTCQPLAIVLAGGTGLRLHPLTEERPKAAIPFGGIYRLIDFTLSNCVNSSIRRMLIFTQYKADSLNEHLHKNWDFLSQELGDFIRTVPPQQRVNKEWFRGTADCIYQNWYMLRRLNPSVVLVLSGDHLYKMDYRSLIDNHLQHKAQATIASVLVPLPMANQFSVMDVDLQNQVTRFENKPEKPWATTDDPTKALISMGIYLFDPEVLLRELQEGPGQNQRFDFSRDLLPWMVENGRKIVAYRFDQDKTSASHYWRDVGTLDTYYEASMDLLSANPPLDLYEEKWPIRGERLQVPPTRFSYTLDHPGGRYGKALDSLVAGGCLIHGGFVHHSVLSPKVHIHSHAEVRDSILLEGVEVGKYAKIRNAIIDEYVKIPDYARIGYNFEEDRKSFHVAESDLVVISNSTIFENRQIPTEQSSPDNNNSQERPAVASSRRR